VTGCFFSAGVVLGDDEDGGVGDIASDSALTVFGFGFTFGGSLRTALVGFEALGGDGCGLVFFTGCLCELADVGAMGCLELAAVEGYADAGRGAAVASVERD